MAKLYFRYGAMGSGKSIDLLKVAHNYEEKGQKVLLFTPSADTRNGIGNITTRIGLQREAHAIDKNFDIYVYVSNISEKPNAILVDEAQFLTKAHVIQLTNIVDFLDIPVICYGLKSDFRCELFEGSKALVEFADSIEEIKTICECGKKATINMRCINGTPTIKGEQILIGGNESYKSVCRKCYKRYLEKYFDGIFNGGRYVF